MPQAGVLSLTAMIVLFIWCPDAGQVSKIAHLLFSVGWLYWGPGHTHLYRIIDFDVLYTRGLLANADGHFHVP